MLEGTASEIEGLVESWHLQKPDPALRNYLQPPRASGRVTFWNQHIVPYFGAEPKTRLEEEAIPLTEEEIEANLDVLEYCL